MEDPLAIVLDMDGRGAGKLGNIIEAVTFFVTALGLSLPYPSRMDLAVIAAFPRRAEFVLSGNWRHIASLGEKMKRMCERHPIHHDSEELETSLAQGVSRALCFLRKYSKNSSRIILFEHSFHPTEFSSQSVALSNCGWAATASLTRIHLVSLSSLNPSSALLALCFKSGGTHIPFKHTQTLGELIQAMLFHLPAHGEGLLHQLKVRPDPPNQHMGAVCACHNKSLDKGYVCSICLYIYCSETAGTCAVCGSRIRREAKDELAISAQIFSKLFAPSANSIFQQI